MGFGWGTVAGFIADRFPSRDESIRNKIDKLERERSELLKMESNPKNQRRLGRVLSKLRVLRQKSQNK